MNPITFLVLLGGFAWSLHLLIGAGKASLPLRRLVWASAATRLLVALLFYFASAQKWPFFRPLQHPESGFWNFAMDAVATHRYALGILSAWRTGAPYPVFTSGAIEYHFLVAVLYRLFGPYPLHAILFNLWCSVAQISLVVWLAKNVTSENNAIRAGWLAALWPSGILWSAQLLKDAPLGLAVMGALASSAWLWQTAQGRRHPLLSRIGCWAGLILSFVVATKLRSYIGMAMAASVFIVFAGASIRSLFKKEGALAAHAFGIAMAATIGMAIGYQLPYPQRWCIIEYTYVPPMVGVPEAARPQEIRRPGQPGTVSAPFAFGYLRMSGGVQPDSAPLAFGYLKVPRIFDLRPVSDMAPAIQFFGYLKVPTVFDLWPLSDMAPAIWFVESQTNAIFRSMSGQASLSKFMQVRRGMLGEGGRSTVYPHVTFTSMRDLLEFSPRALMVVWFSPFPTQWLETEGVTGVFRFFGGGETLLFYLLLPWVLKGLWRLIRQGQAMGWLIIAFIGMTSLILGLCIPNVGTLFRLRLPVMLLWLLIASLGFEKTATLPHGEPRRA